MSGRRPITLRTADTLVGRPESVRIVPTMFGWWSAENNSLLPCGEATGCPRSSSEVASQDG